MNYLFTSESVSEGHPDKVSDQISDAVLDEFLRQDEEAKVACETFCTTGLVVVGGEVRSESAYVDIQHVVRDVIDRIGYNKADYMFDANSCGVLSAIHDQSGDINQGVVRENPEDQGAGDQGMMFGYACRDTEDYMPLPLALSHLTLLTLADIRKNRLELMPYLRPDAKAQFTIEYDGETNKPVRIHTIVVSTQHDEFAGEKAMHDKIEADVRNILIPEVISQLPAETAALFDGKFILHVNPTGKFVIGGPHGDTGLTGRKIIVDTYGGKGAHGGGAFSGKDPSKVDRSAAYAARYIAKNMVAAGVADEMLVQVSYAIGVARPVSIYVETYGTAKNGLKDSEIAEKIGEIFDLRPAKIIEKFQLKNPIYEPTASYGHMGRKPYTKTVTLIRDGKEVRRPIRFFGWEDLDSVDKIKAAFSL
ncbi:MAG: methionine adenosyltransferase [Bacteroidales bacterium]|nr:methionine adenosyltransferase [Bacteroidales bacterium]SKC38069.1 methionine adenosyltransferase [Bacteroidales bacterium WCE2008]MBQ2109499.1 methionine adenosyltransferase [Bacteroidales bacterium]MBQ2526986.1 methionine adenosyltransferase [Bacteroidales bacterium]MBQ3916725.1 methionine adenosyltransferase [Bacteroidales bacterium]